MAETILVIAIICAAAVYLLRDLYRRFRRGSCGGCSCDKCADEKDCDSAVSRK